MLRSHLAMKNYIVQYKLRYNIVNPIGNKITKKNKNPPDIITFLI